MDGAHGMESTGMMKEISRENVYGKRVREGGLPAYDVEKGNKNVLKP